MSLFNKYRPNSFEEMIGDFSCIEKALSREDHDRAFLFTGGTGCGKTTASMLLSKRVGADPMDVSSIDCANNGAVDLIRKELEKIHEAPWGQARVFIWNEVHTLSDTALQAFLDPIEFGPPNVYHIFTSNRLDEISGKRSKSWTTLKSRMYQIDFPPIDPTDLMMLLHDICTAEGVLIDKKVLYSIASISEGSARLAITTLEQIIDAEPSKWNDIITVSRTGESPDVLALCKAVYYNKGTSLRLLGEMKKAGKEDPEGVRRALLGYGANIATTGSAASCVEIVRCLTTDAVMRDGWNGLIAIVAYAITRRSN